VIIDVPAAIPVTIPELETVAIDVLADTQGFVVEAVAEPVNWMVEPTQTALFPVIVGFALTVTVIVLVVAH
jgi:hypothetical protein